MEQFSDRFHRILFGRIRNSPCIKASSLTVSSLISTMFKLVLIALCALFACSAAVFVNDNVCQPAIAEIAHKTCNGEVSL